MAIFTGLLRGFFDLLLAPFQGMPAMVTLFPISLIVSIAALYVFKKTSDQDAMDQVKRNIHASIFEIRLFNDDLRAILRAQIEVFGHVLNQFRLTLIPLLWMLPPIVLLMTHLEYHYGYSGFEPGDQVLVTAVLKGEPDALAFDKPDFSLRSPAGVEVETAALWIPSLNELTWRVLAEESGAYELEIVAADGSITTKSLQISDEIVRRSPERPSGLLWQLWFPQETTLASDSPFKAIRIDYPHAEMSVFGLFDFSWLYVFFLLTVVFGFALRKPMGVTI
jgi:uncharacterized membrane protein (DUF106 family)